MAHFVETILPSGRAVRIAALTPRQGMQIDRQVTQTKGDDHSRTIEVLCTCLKAYTKTPIPIVWKLAADMKTPLRDPEGSLIADLDATFEAAKKGNLWVPVTYDELKEEGGPHNLLDTFEDFRDWNALGRHVQGAPGAGKETSPIAGKVRTRSAL